MKVPLKKHESIIILEVKLIGKLGIRRVNMALDTGSTFVIAPWEVIESLGYDPASSKKRVIITTANSIERAPVVTIESIGIADLSVENPEIVGHNLPPGSRVEGLLGLDFLKACETEYKNGFLEIKDS